MSKIAPCLWFGGQAEEAVRFSVSLLPRRQREPAGLDQVWDTCDDGFMPPVAVDPIAP